MISYGLGPEGSDAPIALKGFQPHALDAPLWRYMAFSKFVSMISTRTLYFARADHLGDAFEGSIPRQVAKEEERQVAAGELHPQSFSNMQRFRKSSRAYTLVNCWHMNDHESAAMWDRYGLKEEGIALRSTVARLTQCLPTSPVSRSTPEARVFPIYVVAVNYIDYEADVDVELWQRNGFAPHVHKRKVFEHEREVRAIVAEFPIVHTGPHQAVIDESGPSSPWPSGGDRVPVDLTVLVEAIYASPTAPSWFEELVRSVVRLR